MLLPRLAISAVLLSAAFPAWSQQSAQPYRPPGGVPLLQQPAATSPDGVVRSSPRDLARSNCSAASLIEIAIGGQILRVPAAHLQTVVTAQRPQLSDGCPGSPVEAVSVVLRVGGSGPMVIVSPNAPKQAFTAMVAGLKDSSFCKPHASSLAECVPPDDANARFYLDRAGPVDQFDNPPSMMLMRPPVGYALPYTHPSGLFAMVMLPKTEVVEFAPVRQSRLLMEHAFALYLGETWKPQIHDPGMIVVQDFSDLQSGIVAYQVDAKNWATNDALALRACPEATTVELQVGPVRFTVPRDQLRGFQATATTKALDGGRKAYAASASCPGQPMHVGGFRAMVDGRMIEVDGRGRNVQAQLGSVMDRIVETGSCTQTAEGPRLCEVRAPEAVQGVYRVEDKDFPVSVMCMTPKGVTRGCMLAAEVDLGFSYAVNLSEKPSAGTNWAAEVKRMPDLIRALRPTPVPVSAAKPAAGRAL